MSLNKQPEVISLDPQLLGDIIENVRMLGRATGAEERADEIAEDMEARIEAVTARAARRRHQAQRAARGMGRPADVRRPLGAGRWWTWPAEATPSATRTPAPSSWSGKRSSSANPDIIVMMPCGFDVKRGLEDVPILAEREGWKDLPAVRNDRVYVVDASAYTSRSGPRLGDWPGDHGRDDSPGVVQRQNPGTGGAETVQRLTPEKTRVKRRRRG